MAPGNPALRRRAAAQLIELGEPAEAADLLDGLADDMAALLLRGVALHDLGDFAQAGDAFRRMTHRAPELAAGWANLGMIAKVEGRFDEASLAYDTAVTLAPDDARIRLNRAIALLRAGLLEEGWSDYECRMRIGGHEASHPPELMLPPVGGLRLEGKTILATHEDGFGDTLQFCRYLPLLAALGARVVVRAPRALTALLGTLEGVAAIEPEEPDPAFDWHIPMFSLPRVFATRLDTIPASTPYLHPDPRSVLAWGTKLPPRRRLRVGVAWAGQARPWAEGFAALDRRRSLPLASLAPLADAPGVDLVSLQAGSPAAEIAGCGFAIHDPMRGIADFAETAAIVANLDMVVSVDTSVIHLAGALAAPASLLDRYDSCWRWFSGRSDSPWYPGLRIFRQTRPGDFAPAIADVADRLRTLSPASPSDDKPPEKR